MLKRSFLIIPVLWLVPLTAIAMTGQEALQLGKKAFHGDSAALDKLKESAESGSSNAQCWLGNYYFLVKHDFSKSTFWLQKAADHGNAIAETSLGFSYYRGLGVPQNYAKADYWYLKAADQGYAEAENNLGNSYHNGQGIPQNYAKANYWFQKAADQGNAMAENNLGFSYYRLFVRLSG
jgi:TPR repeat protein